MIVAVFRSFKNRDSSIVPLMTLEAENIDDAIRQFYAEDGPRSRFDERWQFEFAEDEFSKLLETV